MSTSQGYQILRLSQFHNILAINQKWVNHKTEKKKGALLDLFLPLAKPRRDCLRKSKEGKVADGSLWETEFERRWGENRVVVLEKVRALVKLVELRRRKRKEFREEIVRLRCSRAIFTLSPPGFYLLAVLLSSSLYFISLPGRV